MTDPPDGWQFCPLVDLISHKSGDSKIIKGKQSDRPFPGLVQGFSASGPDVWVDTGHFVGAGVVASAVGARCGKTFLAEGTWTAIANTHALLPGPDIRAKYLWYLTNREEWWVRGGTAQPFLRVKDTLERKQLVPPQAEQDEIVRILDTQLARLDTLLRSVQAVQDKADQFRRSLLHAAFTGQLTQPDPSRGDDLPEGWAIRGLGELVGNKSDIVDGPFGSHLKSAHYTDDGALVIRLQNIGFGKFLKAEAYISLEHYASLEKHQVSPGDLLFASLGERLPRACLAPSLGRPAIVKADCIRVRLSDRVNASYVMWATQRPAARNWAEDLLHGMGRPRLGLKNIREFPVPLPARAEQDKIVRILGAQLTRLEKALEVADRVEVECGRLRRSLLQAAFTGELTRKWRESRG